MILDSCPKLTSFTGMLRKSPHLGPKFKHLELDPTTEGCGSALQQYMKIVGYPMRHCTALETLSCTVEGLKCLGEQFSKPENAFPSLKWLTLWHSDGAAPVGTASGGIASDKTSVAIARRIEYLHLVWPISLYKDLSGDRVGQDEDEPIAEEPLFPNVRRVVALVNEQRMSTEDLVEDCERLREACPNVEDIALVSNVVVPEDVDDAKLKEAKARLVGVKETKPGAIGRYIFMESLTDRDWVWRASTSLEMDFNTIASIKITM